MSRSNETKNTSSPNFIFLVERDISSNNISLYEIKNGQKGKLLNKFTNLNLKNSFFGVTLLKTVRKNVAYSSTSDRL